MFIQENAFESVVCEMAAMLPWPQCVNSSPLDKMTAISLTIFSGAFLVNEKLDVLIKKITVCCYGTNLH